MIEALDGVEFFVGQDHFLTPTVRYADIVLPATTFWERNDVHTPWAGALHYAIFMKQAIQPMYECRNDIDIFADLARRVGIAGYNDKTETEWLRELTADAVPDFEAFRSAAWRASRRPRTRWPSPRQIRDPDNHKFSTPSGKIEIYSMKLAETPIRMGLAASRRSRPGSPRSIPTCPIRCSCAAPSRGRARIRSTATSPAWRGSTATTSG